MTAAPDPLLRLLAIESNIRPSRSVLMIVTGSIRVKVPYPDPLPYPLPIQVWFGPQPPTIPS